MTSFYSLIICTDLQERLATDWTVRGSNAGGGGGEIFRTCPDRPWGPPSLLCSGCRVLTGGKAAGAWRWPPTPSSAEVKERAELYVLPFLWDFVTCCMLKLPLPLPIFKKYVTCDGANDIPVARTYCPPLHALCDVELICFCNFPELLSASMSSRKRLHCVGWHQPLHVG